MKECRERKCGSYEILVRKEKINDVLNRVNEVILITLYFITAYIVSLLTVCYCKHNIIYHHILLHRNSLLTNSVWNSNNQAARGEKEFLSE